MHPLISARELATRTSDPSLRIVDVRFDLAATEAGRARYDAGHLPGAVYLHLDDDLSGPLRPDGLGGRHPLPDPDRFAARLGELGIGDEHEVVVYDDAGSAIAGRLWWLLTWIGRPAVRVLDGGVDAWTEAGGGWVRDVPRHPPARSTARPDAAMVVSAEEVGALARSPDALVIDARAAERYRGETEPLDRKAGHVPGAVNLPYAGNLEGKRFLDADRLAERYAAAADARDVVVYCGSGVTAVHDALAMRLAGLAMPKLYAGSWSDWSSHDDLPVAVGDDGAHAPHPDAG